VRHPSADDYNPGRSVRLFVDGVSISGEATDRAWLGRWVSASRQLLETESIAPDIEADAGTHAKSELTIVRAPVDRRMLADAVWRATWPHDRLVLGASRLIGASRESTERSRQHSASPWPVKPRQAMRVSPVFFSAIWRSSTMSGH
jgi:hypothetical protein